MIIQFFFKVYELLPSTINHQQNIMIRLLYIFCFVLFSLFCTAQQHPVAFITKADAAFVKANLEKYPVLQKSFRELKNQIDPLLTQDIDVPFPKDPAGGYTHDRHKANYMLMFNAGLLYNVTGDAKYALFVKNILKKYAAMNPGLKNHPEATSSSPGRIFWQALNDANWMLYSGLAYDMVRNSFTTAERKQIEDGAFKPEVDYVTRDLKDWFNLLHNHAVWACAGVGAIGIATDNKDYIDMALYGTTKDGKKGFLAQMDNLFSPDGYYTEGPYYTRYAILPYALLANAVNNTNPGIKIFEHRDRILFKALNTCLQQTNINGQFFPLNDALKEKDYTSNELVTAVDIFWKVYGPNNNWLAVAEKQDRVIVSRGGAEVAAALAAKPGAKMNYKTLESTDGVKGDEGGVSILRAGSGKDLTSLIFKYTSHGLSHGHFDKLNINLFDHGNEILTDYGSVRFIGVEQKYGGRYLPENTKYAAQTIAHNTLVADETSHFNGIGEEGEKYHSDKLYNNFSNPDALVIAAKDEHAYSNIAMQRQVALINIPGGKRLVVDIFEANSQSAHQYDLPFQYNGQLISTSFPYRTFATSLQTLGSKNGYQFLWKEAEADVKAPMVQFTFLNQAKFYTLSSLVPDSAKIFLTRSGANDPNFNLRREPAFIIRRKDTSPVFVNVLEIHGDYDSVNEFSKDAYSSISSIAMIENNADQLLVEIITGGKKLQLAKMKKDFSTTSNHTTAGGLTWKGPYAIWYDGKKM